MTRLVPNNISGLGQSLKDYDLELQRKTGYSLKDISLIASGLSEPDFTERTENCFFAIVPITSGQGIISGFSEAVCDIISFLGCDAKITTASDISGLAEAFQSRADFIFCSDDNDFISLDTKSRLVVHNDQATAKAYVSVLKVQQIERNGKILVLGCGHIGQAALEELLSDNHHVAVYDPDTVKVDAWYRNLSSGKKKYTEILRRFPKELDEYIGLLDATPANDIIDKESIHENLVIAAPGVPLGLTPAACLNYQHHVVHDPLQLGVAVMVTLCAKNLLC